MKQLLLLILIAFPILMKAQSNNSLMVGDTACNKRQIFEKVEQNPGYNGGIEILFKKLNRYLKMDDTLNGNLTLILGINCTGHVFGIDIKKGINDELNMQIIKAVLANQDWMPGKQNGYPVDCSIPVRFKIVDGQFKF